MLGSESLIQSLVDAGVDTCFMNPGTSEMHFVHALDAVPEMRSVLALFEGVATGAADGYARMTGRPAAILLHLGPGLGNGLANLHNAKRAKTPVICIVGAHATYHAKYDAPLQSDIEGIARAVSGWVRTSAHQRDVAHDAMDALAAATRPPGQVATLVLPADVSWSEGGALARPHAPVPPVPVAAETIAATAQMLRDGQRSVLLIGGTALRERGLLAASRIEQATGAIVLAGSTSRYERGAGLPKIPQVAYLGEMAQAQIGAAARMILAGARSPVTFFAYPGRPSDLVPDDCAVEILADDTQDIPGALEALADLVAPDVLPVLPPPGVAAAPTGELTTRTLADAIAATLPEDAIIVDEAITSGGYIADALAGAPRHDVLPLTGGAIGQGLPTAVGAAVAAPHRPVLSLQADGSAMYTIQALWTQAREDLNVTTILLNNGSYAILRAELDRVGAGSPGKHALDMLDLTRPGLSFVDLARGLGVDSVRVSTADELVDALRRAHAEPGPHLIEAMLPSPD